MISILMSVRNAEQFLEECLDSILNQSYSDWELIAIDDNSTDGSYELLTKYSQGDKRIRSEKIHGSGIISALRQAYKLSKGEYITRMDADDVMPENKLKALRELSGRKVVVTGKVQYFSAGSVSEGYQRYEDWLNEIKAGEHYNNIYRECTVASPNWLVHADFFEDDFEWEKWTYPEDYDMLFHWKKAAYEIRSVTEVTHLWREHPERTSRTSDRYQQASFFKLKTDWFIRNEVNKQDQLQLIGTGRKAKLVKANLESKNVPYIQFSYGPNNEYLLLEDLDSSKKTILTNWPIGRESRKEIESFLNKHGFFFGRNLWLF
jgi:glycosyltransferase involved in cell wall biosynthesis